MDRRAVLCLVAAALSGCANSPAGGTPSPRVITKTVFRTRTPPDPSLAPTPASTPPTTTATATDTATATSTTTQNPTPTQIQSPTISPEVAKVNERISELREIIAEMIQVYASFGTSSSILDVTAQSSSFSPTEINGLASDAQTILANTTAQTDDQEQRLTRIEEMVLFLRLSAFSQNSIVRSFEKLTSGKNDAFAGDHDEAEDMLDGAEDSRKNAERNLDLITQRTTAMATAVTPELSASDYEMKVDQFQSEIGSLGDVRIFLSDFITADRQLDDARSSCDQSEGVDAANAFDDLQDDIRGTDVAGSMEDLAREVREEASNREDEADDIAAGIC